MNVFYKIFCRVYQGAFYLVSYILPWRIPESLKGAGSIKELPAFIKSKGCFNPLIVTDAVLVQLGLIQPLLDGLKSEGLQSVVYDKTVPNPTIDNIEEALKLYKDCKCDSLVAFGGGSPIDCAKGIGARVARPNKSIPKMKGVLKVLKRLPPLFAIPTTSGTGSEATLAAVISNSLTHEKYAINDTSLIPHYAVFDPELTLKLPQHITSTTGVDALTHAVEAYIGNSNTSATKSQAIDATKIVFKYLKRAYDDGTDIEARDQMQTASFLAGMAFTRAYVGYVHAVAHTLGGFYGVPHGLANAVILPYVLEMYGSSVYKKLAELADYANIAAPGDSVEVKAKKFIKAIKDLNASMNIPTKIEGKWKIKDEDIPLMCKRALSEANPLYPVPKIMDAAQITSIYKMIQG
ncbi:MAG: iron-containing alcohol dehydrogenase [Clostridia bacterium]|nr:iron-containing alcohol dehydrogenase [Clostridia bacterium]